MLVLCHGIDCTPPFQFEEKFESYFDCATAGYRVSTLKINGVRTYNCKRKQINNIVCMSRVTRNMRLFFLLTVLITEGVRAEELTTGNLITNGNFETGNANGGLQVVMVEY